jgi:uncharacterized protein (DUF4415 family)
MAIIESTAKAGQGPSEEERARIRAELAEARKHPINLDDCPELSPEALKEFAFMRTEKNRKKKRQTVSIRLAPDCIEAYKSIGKGYTGIMADVLTYAAAHPDYLKQATL